MESPDVTYSKDFIEAKYTYSTVHVCKENGVTKVWAGGWCWGGRGGGAWWWLCSSPCAPASVPQVRPCSTRFTFRTGRQVPRLGVMLVGWGGNNGTTVTAAVLANKLGLSWMTKTGRKVGVPGGTPVRSQDPGVPHGWGDGAQLLPSAPGSCALISSLPLWR